MNVRKDLTALISLSSLQMLFCILYTFNDIFYIFYLILYELCLIYLVIYTRRISIFLVLTISFLLYFYQVPFISLFPDSNVSVYNYIYNSRVGNELLILYSFLSLIFSLFIFISYNICKTDPLDYIKPRLEDFSSIGFIVSAIICSLMILYSIYNAGSIYNLSLMNKFESHESSKILFFTYKEFFILMCIFFFTGKKRSLLKLLLLASIISFELFLAKRFLIAVFGVFFILFNKNRFNLRFSILIALGVLLANSTKLIYYSLPYAIMNNVPNFWETVFYFDLEYFLKNMYHIGEFSGHIRLTYLSLQQNIHVTYKDFISLLLAGLPLSNSLFDINYIPIGERLRLSLNEDWAGLASSTYIAPYLSLGYLGVIFTYLVYFIYLNTLLYLSKIHTLFMILLLYICPVMLFYFHREPILIIFKTLTVGLPVVALVYMLVLIFKSILSSTKSS